MSAASRILPLADCFCWRADMSASISPSRHTNGLLATPLDAPVHKTGDVQGGRDNADAVANDLGRDEQSVHSRSLLVRHIFGSGADRSAVCAHPLSIPTSWYVVKWLFLTMPLLCFVPQVRRKNKCRLRAKKPTYGGAVLRIEGRSDI